MKKSIYFRPLFRSCLVAAIGASFAQQVSRAADIIWSGGDATANWSAAGNWSGAAPVNGDNIILSGNNQTINTNDLTGLSAGWLQFANGDFWIYGNNLSVGGLTNIGGNNVLYMPITLSAAVNCDVLAGSSLAISNTTSLGSYPLAVVGEGDLVLAGVVSGPTGITKSGNGTFTLAALNTYAGGLTVNMGTVNANSANAAGNGSVGSGNLVVNNGGMVSVNMDNALLGQGATVAPPRSVTINAGGTVSTGDRSGHMAALTLNGGTLGASTARNDYGNWNLDYGVSTPGNGSSSTISGGNVTLGQTGGTIFNVGAGDTLTVASVIARTTYATDAGLIKNGAGILDLSTDNTYQSSTIVNAGTLRLSSAQAVGRTPLINVGSGAVLDVTTVGFTLNTNQTLAGSGTILGSFSDNSPAIITPGGNGAAGTLTFDSLYLSGNLSLNIDLANTTTAGGANDLLVVTNLTLAGSGIATNTVSFGFVNGTPVVGGVYTLVKYVNYNGPSVIVDTLASAPTRYTFTFTNDTSASAIKVIVGGNPAALVWKGDAINNYWDIVSTPNWLKGGLTDRFYQADNVILNDTGSSSPSVNIVTPVTPSSVLVDATKDYTLAGSGKITGNASLVKSNTGSLLLLTDNDQTGTTRIEGGTMVVGNGATSGLPGAGAIVNNGMLVFNRSDSPTLSSPVSGTGKMVKFGAGTVVTAVSNTFTGSLTISNGGIQLGNITSGSAGFPGSITNYGLLGIRGTNSPNIRGAITGTSGIQLFGTNSVRLGNVNLVGTAAIEVGNNNGTAGRPELVVADGDKVTVGRLFAGQTGSYNGNVTQTGGALTITDLTETEGPMRLGHWPTETSTYTMSGGQLVITGGPNARISLGIDGTGVWNMLGGVATVSRIDVNGRSATGGGFLNVTNGTILVGAGGINGFAPYTMNLAGGTLGSIANWTSAITNTLAGTVTFDTGPYAITLSGPCIGAGAISKTGAGALNLNGASSSTGALTVQAGTLQGSGTFSGNINVQAPGAISAGATLATGTLTASNVTLTAGASVAIDLSSTAATSDLLTVKGNLTLDAATPLALNFLGGIPYNGGTYTIITNWGTRTGSLTYANPTRYAVNLDQTNPKRVQVTFSGSNAALVWRGDVNNFWNSNADANWLNGNVASSYLQNDSVVFDANGIGTPNVTLAADMTPASVTVNSSGDYSLSGGAITTVGNLVKSGSGTLTLANSNAFGTTVLNSGTIQVGNGGTSGTLAGNIADFGSLVFNRSDASVSSSLISGPGSFTQAGSGVLTVLGNSTFYGGARINPGTTVQVGNGLAADSGLLGNGPINNFGTLVYNRAGSPVLNAPHTGNGAINFLGVGYIGQSSYQLAGTNTFTGPVGLSNVRLYSAIGGMGLGNPAIITVPTGSQIYAVAASFSSVASIPLSLSGAGWQESAGYVGALRLQNGMNWAGPITLNGNTRISAYDNALSNVISGTISGAYEAEFGLNASGFLSLAPSSPNSFSALRVSPGTLWLDNANALPAGIPLIINGGNLKLNGQSSSVTDIASPVAGSVQNGSLTTPATLTVNPSSDALFTGTFADGGPQTLTLVKNGSSVLALTGLSTNQGGVTVNGGVLALRAGGGSGVIRGSVTMQPGTLLLSQNNDSLGYNGGSSQVTNLTLNGASLIHTPGNNLTFWNNSVVNMNGAYVAATNVGGRIDLGTGAAVNVLASANSSVIAGASLYLRQGNTVFTVADGAAQDDLLVTAPITQAAANYSLTKNGAGRMKVTNGFGPNGAVTVNGGSLVLSGPASVLTNSGAITLESGTTLDISSPGAWTMAANQILQGSGTVVGNVTDNSGTVIRMGTSVGTLTVSGGLSVSGAGSLTFKLGNTTAVGGTANDLIQVNGNLSLSDVATAVNFTFLNGLPASGTYTLIKYTGSLSGTAAGLTNYSGSLATFSIDTASKAVKVTFNAPGNSLVWQGDGGANAWDYETTSVNWFDGSSNTNFNQLDAVRFDDTRTTANTSVSIVGSVSPSSITFDSINNYSIIGSGKITGVGSITKNNTGTTTLGTVNELAGPVNVNAGTLALGINDSYVNATTVTVANGAAFNFGGMNDNVIGRGHDFVIAGPGPDGQGALRNETYDIYEYANVSNLTLNADSVLGAGANTRWDIGPAVNSKVDGKGFSLTKVGDGTINMRVQTLTNLSSITVSNGTFFYESYDQTNSWTATTTNFVKPGATLSAYGARQINMPIELDGAKMASRNSTPTWLGPVQLSSASVFNNSLPQVFSGVISGPGALWIDGGTAAITLSNANTYSGGTVISNAPASTLGAGAVGTAALLVRNPSALGTGSVTINGTGYASLATNAFFFATNVLRPLEINVSSGGVVANSIVLPSSTITNVAIQGRDASSIFTLSGRISGGFVGMTNWFDNSSGAVGVIRLSNPANDFVASRIFLNRGTLALTADALGAPGNILIPAASSTVRFDSPMTLSHTLNAVNNPTYLDMFGDNNGDGIQDTVNPVTIGGLISGAGTIYPRGTNGTMTLTGANTFSGGFELQQPLTLQVAAVTNLGTAYVAIKFGSTLRYTGSGSETMTRTIWMDSGSGGYIDIQNAGASLTWNPGGGTANQDFTKIGAGALTYGGVISGNAVVRVNGGTLTLAGTNTYLGPTFVNSGKLFVNGSLPAANAVVVASGSTLGGTGTINCPVDLQTGSFLRPGVNAIGTLTINSPLTLGAGSSTFMEMDGGAATCDRVASASTVTYGGTLTVNNLGATPAAGTRFKLFSAVDRLGSFSSISLPTLPPPLTWSNSLAIDGSITAVLGVNTTPTNITAVVSGGNLNISWPSDHTGWRLEVQTNSVAVGISTNWVTVPGSTTVNSVAVPLDPVNPTVFYRLVYP